MMTTFPAWLEDEHYARMQYEYEHRGDGEPLIESDLISVDEEEAEKIIEMTGYPVEELGEPDLEEIVSEWRGVYPESVRYDTRLSAICYTYQAA